MDDMDEAEALRIFVAGVKRKAGKEKVRKEESRRLADLSAAVKQGTLEALAVAQPKPEPFNMMKVNGAAARHAYPGAADLFLDATPTAPLPSVSVSAAERLRLERRGAELEAGRIDFKTASPQQAERRLRQLGVDGVLLGDLGLRPVTPKQPPAALDDSSRQIERQAKAARELKAARQIAKTFKETLDARELSADAYQLYLREKKLDPNAPILDSGGALIRDGGK
jgi:hypothetical protein